MRGDARRQLHRTHVARRVADEAGLLQRRARLIAWARSGRRRLRQVVEGVGAGLAARLLLAEGRDVAVHGVQRGAAGQQRQGHAQGPQAVSLRVLGVSGDGIGIDAARGRTVVVIVEGPVAGAIGHPLLLGAR